MDEQLEVENLQPYADTHASYNTAKLQMINQKNFSEYYIRHTTCGIILFQKDITSNISTLCN